jgi:hypothetical protein
VSKFGGIFFTPIRSTAVDCYASGLLKVRLSFKGQNEPPPPKPLHKHPYIYISPLLVTASFSQLTRHVCFHYSLLWGSLWVEISTLAYEGTLIVDQKCC